MRERTLERLPGLFPALYLLLFFFLPVAALVAYAFAHGERAPWETWARLAETAYYRNRIFFTFQQATLSTVLTIALGLPLAYVFSHYDWPGRGTLRAAFTAPFVLPTLVVALSFQALLGRGGWLGVDVLALLGPLGSVLLAHVFYNLSLVVRLVGNYWQRLPDAYREAAQTLGLSRAQATWRVELALLRPALLAAALLIFVFTAASFGIILLLGAPRSGTLETLIYEELRSFRPDYATAASLALLQLATTYLALLIFARLHRRLTTTWRPKTRVDRKRLPAWGAAALALAALFLIGPPLALLAASLRTPDGWGVDAYRILWTNAHPLGQYSVGDAALNSLRFAAGTLLLALPLAALAAWSHHRRPTPWAQALLLLPLGLSAVVVGLGLLLTWNGQVLPDLRTSGLWIILAHTLVAFPFAARVLLPSLDAVDPALRETARTLGASSGRLITRLEFPLSYPALGVAAVFVFGTSLGEFGAALILRRPETSTLPLALFDAFSRTGFVFRQQAYALACILFLVAFLGFLLLERARIRTWGEFA